MRAYILVLLVAVALVSLCVSQPADTGTADTGTSQPQDISTAVTPVETPQAQPAPQASIEPIVIQGSMEIGAEQCSLRNIGGKVLVIHAIGCAECPYVVEKIKSYERELGTSVEYLDQEADAARLSALQISVADKMYMPAVIIGCKAYTGNMGDRFYKEQMQAL